MTRTCPVRSELRLASGDLLGRPPHSLPVDQGIGSTLAADDQNTAGVEVQGLAQVGIEGGGDQAGGGGAADAAAIGGSPSWPAASTRMVSAAASSGRASTSSIVTRRTSQAAVTFARGKARP